MRCQTVVVFSACTDCIVLLTSRLVRLQCSLLFFVFLCIPLCASSYRGLPPLHLPFRVIYGLVADGSAYRSELRAASPASLLLPPLRLVLPWWSNHLRGRGFCLSLTARGSTHHLYICCPNKPPLYPHLNPASPSWQVKRAHCSLIINYTHHKPLLGKYNLSHILIRLNSYLTKIHFKSNYNTAFPRLFKQRTNYTVSKAHLLYQRIIIDFSY